MGGSPSLLCSLGKIWRILHLEGARSSLGLAASWDMGTGVPVPPGSLHPLSALGIQPLTLVSVPKPLHQSLAEGKQSSWPTLCLPAPVTSCHQIILGMRPPASSLTDTWPLWGCPAVG